jgi:hypothetical protein
MAVVNGSGSLQNDLENVLLESLMKLEIISPQFTGSVTIHIGQGAISDIDRYEKCLLRSRRSANIRIPSEPHCP